MTKQENKTSNLDTIRVKCDIHADGDVYVYNKEKKRYYRIGILIPDNISGFLFLPNGDLVSAPMINPCYKKAKKILSKK